MRFNGRAIGSRRRKERGARDGRDRAPKGVVVIHVAKGIARCREYPTAQPTAELYAHPRVLANYTAVERAKIIRSLRALAAEFGTFLRRINERGVINITI